MSFAMVCLRYLKLMSEYPIPLHSAVRLHFLPFAFLARLSRGHGVDLEEIA